MQSGIIPNKSLPMARAVMLFVHKNNERISQLVNPFLRRNICKISVAERRGKVNENKRFQKKKRVHYTKGILPYGCIP